MANIYQQLKEAPITLTTAIERLRQRRASLEAQYVDAVVDRDYIGGIDPSLVLATIQDIDWALAAFKAEPAIRQEAKANG